MEFVPYIKDKPQTFSEKAMASPEFVKWWCTLEAAAVQNFYHGRFKVTFSRKKE